MTSRCAGNKRIKEIACLVWALIVTTVHVQISPPTPFARFLNTHSSSTYMATTKYMYIRGLRARSVADFDRTTIKHNLLFGGGFSIYQYMYPSLALAFTDVLNSLGGRGRGL